MVSKLEAYGAGATDATAGGAAPRAAQRGRHVDSAHSEARAASAAFDARVEASSQQQRPRRAKLGRQRASPGASPLSNKSSPGLATLL